MSTANCWPRTWLVAIVIAHAGVAIWHGLAHAQIPVPLTIGQSAFVVIVIAMLPLIGAGMLWSGRKRDAAILIAMSMFASLIFGVVNHFVLDSSDHVSRVPAHAWRPSFVVSAVLVAISEALSTILGAYAAIRWRAVAP